VIDAVHAPPPDTDDAAVLDGDVQPVAVGVQYRRGLHPAVHVIAMQPGLQICVDSPRPRLTTAVRRSAAPRLGNAIDHHEELPWSAPAGYPSVVRPHAGQAGMLVRAVGRPIGSHAVSTETMPDTEDQLEQLHAGPQKTNFEAVADPRQSPTMPMCLLSR
jgi:hypothetical protein